MQAYVLKVGHRAAEKLPAGAVVYRCVRPDYGLANDDTVVTGIEHISVTENKDGDYPCFTVPREDLLIV